MGNRGDKLSDQPGQAESYSRASQEKLLGLTVRELEVLSLLVTGKSNKEIARDLYISTSTVKSHVTSILRALDLDSRTSAAVFWTRALYEK
jgi:DNA-binding NarL/FixJ family response regulator